MTSLLGRSNLAEEGKQTYALRDPLIGVSTVKIEYFVGRISQAPFGAETVARAAGKAVQSPDHTFAVAIDRPPFEAARVFARQIAQAPVIQVDFAFIPGTWRLRDVSGETAAWREGPLLPDTGRRALSRDWDWDGLSITCVIGVDSEGVGPEAIVRTMTCLVTPLSTQLR